MLGHLHCGIWGPDQVVGPVARGMWAPSGAYLAPFAAALGSLLPLVKITPWQAHWFFAEPDATIAPQQSITPILRRISRRKAKPILSHRRTVLDLGFATAFPKLPASWSCREMICGCKTLPPNGMLEAGSMILALEGIFPSAPSGPCNPALPNSR